MIAKLMLLSIQFKIEHSPVYEPFSNSEIFCVPIFKFEFLYICPNEVMSGERAKPKYMKNY